MHAQKKHSRHTYPAARRKAVLRQKRRRQLRQLCIKCALCTSVFTLTLLADSEWKLSRSQFDFRNQSASKTAALIHMNADTQLFSYDDTHPDSRQTDNRTNAPSKDSATGQPTNNPDTGRLAKEPQTENVQTPSDDSAVQNPEPEQNPASSATGQPDASAEHTDKKPAQIYNTDEQSRYVVYPDTDGQLSYSYTDNQVQYSANSGSLIPSVPEPLPAEQLVDTTTDDTDTTHFTQDSSDWNLILVNPWNEIPQDYEINLTSLSNGHSIDSRCYSAFTKMMDDCRKAGLHPLICSSYRTQEKQESLFQERIDELLAQGYSKKEARRKAATSVARPGTSEHQLGLAVDIVDSSHQTLDAMQEYTPVQQWLMENSWRYGFILRYPNDKSRLTGIIYEPWHYRYVGLEAAQEIYERGLCLEEYLEEQN